MICSDGVGVLTFVKAYRKVFLDVKAVWMSAVPLYKEQPIYSCLLPQLFLCFSSQGWTLLL